MNLQSKWKTGNKGFFLILVGL